MAEVAEITGGTGAHERPAVTAGARPAVQAGLQDALVGRMVAVVSREAGGADAAIVIDTVHTGPAVGAGACRTLVDVDLAVLTRETGPAAAEPQVADDVTLPTYTRKINSVGTRRSGQTRPPQMSQIRIMPLNLSKLFANYTHPLQVVLHAVPQL